MDILDHFFTAVEKALYAVSNGCNMAEELSLLKPLQSELRNAFDNLTLRPDPIAMAAKRSASLQQRREEQVFMLSWRSGGDAEYITGWQALAKHIRLSINSINVYLSRGKGAFTLSRYNPITWERDQLVVVKLEREDLPKPKRGRPSQTFKQEDEYNDFSGAVFKKKPKSRSNNKIPTDDPNIP